MYRTMVAVLMSIFFAAPGFAQSACEALALSERREAARGCSENCICEEVQEGFMRAKSS